MSTKELVLLCVIIFKSEPDSCQFEYLKMVSIEIFIVISDVNECELSLEPCYNGATCNNYEGTYNCTCASGWEGDDCLDGTTF